MLKDLSPKWADMVARYEELKSNRDADLQLLQPFEITIVNPRDIKPGDDTTSYSMRGGFDRRTELAVGIVLEPNASPFVLLHELTHALPLDVLPAELAALPYQSMDDLGDSPDFDAVYRHLLLEAYQDEAFSTLAEMLLYRDLLAAGTPKTWFNKGDVKFFEKALAIYETEGITGYLRSEVYIGRNHRSSYNHHRILQLAILATCEPQVLARPGLNAVMQEQGVSVEGDPSGLLAQMGEIANLMDNPTPEAITAFAAKVMSSGGNFSIGLDLDTLIANAREHHALVTGKQGKAGASFLGEATLVTHQVAILAESRRRFEAYRTEFEAAWQASGGAVKNFKWDDADGLVAFFQMTVQLETNAQNGEEKSLSELRTKLRTALGKFDFSDALLDLEEARQSGDAKKAARLFEAAVKAQSYLSGGGHEKNLENKPKTRRLNPSLRLLTTILNDTRLNFDIAVAVNDFFKRVWSKGSSRVDFLEQAALDNERDFGDATAFWNHVTSLSARDDQGLIHLIFDNKRLLYLEEQDAKMRSIGELLNDQDVEDTQDETNKSGRKPLLIEGGSLDTEMNFEMASALQIALYHSDVGMPAHAYRIEISRGTTLDEKGRTVDQDTVEGMDGIAYYQRSLRELRDTTSVKPEALEALHQDHGATGPALPVLFFLEPRDTVIPEGIAVVTVSGGGEFSRGAVVDKCPEALWRAHLELETWERGHHATAGYLEVAQFMQEFGESIAILQHIKSEDIKTDIAESPSAFWVATRLAKRTMSVALANGQIDLAVELGQNTLTLMNDLANTAGDSRYTAMARDCAREMEFFLRVLPAYRPNLDDETHGLLAGLADEYATAVKLRRAGFSPLRILDFVRDVAVSPDVREPILKLLTTAATDIASYGPQTPEFRNGVTGFVATVHAAHLTHAQKEAQLTDLLEKVLPNLNAKTRTNDLTLAQRLALFEWFDTTALSEDTLGTIALYPHAEKILFERSSKILAEIGAAALPIDMQGKLVAISRRLESFFRREHAPVLDPTNTDKLARVSASPEYQLDLATVVPSRRAIADATLPVAQWSPVVVRRTMPVETASWQRIQAELGVEASENVLKVYEAYTLREIEKSAQPTLTLDKAKDTYESFMKRRKEMTNSRVKLSAALSMHTQLTQLLNDQEKLQLEGLVALPTVKYALDIAELAFAAGRDLAPNEIDVLKAILAAPTLSDARRKRELYVLVLADARFPIGIRRLAARGLGHASHRNQVLEALSHAYERDKDHAAEEALYNMIVAYWQRVGELPDDHGTLLLDEGKFEATGFWQDFDRVIHTNPAPPLASARELELLALRYGKLSDRFIADAERFVNTQQPQNIGLLFYDDLAEVLPRDFTERAALKPWYAQIKLRQAERADRTALISLDLPSAFIKLPDEAQFLLLRFLQRLPQAQITSLVSDMRSLNANATDAEVFCYFFERVGLVKLGQALATMVGIIPTADRHVLARLQDRTQHSSFTEVVRTIEADLKKPFDEIFSDFNPMPIASASMGEVYEARLRKDNSSVLVKVGPESKMAQNRLAITVLEGVAKDYLEAAVLGRFNSGIDVAALIVRFTRELKAQMDFRVECNNAFNFGQDGYSTTQYVQGLTGQRVLVMIPSDGVKLRAEEIADQEQRKAAATRYARDLFKMIFKGRRYHKDPHPSNELWDEATQQLNWLDWGVTGFVSEADLEKISVLLASLSFFGDAQAIELAVKNITSPGSDADANTLSKALAELDPSLKLGNKLAAILDATGLAGFIVDTNIMETLAVLLTGYSVVEDLDPGHDLAADLMAVMVG